VEIGRCGNRFAAASAVAGALACSTGALAADDGVPGFPGSMPVPGTSTGVKIYGSARLDIIKDIDQGTGGGTASNIPGIAPDGSAQANRKGAYDMTARGTQLGVDIRTQTKSAGLLKVVIEGDFYGGGAGTEVSTNSGNFRLRHAYGEIAGVLAGQYWTNAADIASFPEFLDFTAPAGTVNGIRQPQLRYTTEAGPSLFAVALENPESDFNGANNATFVAGNQAISNNIQDKWPDVTARYAYQGSWGRISTAGVARYISVDTGGATVNGFNGKDGAVGYGVILTGTLNAFGRDRITWMALGGDGIGRYIQYSAANGGGAAIINNKLETIKAYAANLSYQHWWSERVRSTAYYGFSVWDNPTPLVATGLVHKLTQAYVNLVYVPVPNSRIGVEYVRGSVEFESQTPPNGTRGEGSRINILFQYGF
jgi:hypothetical protein